MARTERGAKVSVGQYIFSRLHALGIRHIFGVPGDFNLNLLDHIYKVTGLNWVGTCNELNAAYAADGYARTRGIPGAVITTYGVGELSAINGIAGAYSEHVPIIHIVGTTSRKMQRDRTMIHHTLSDNWDHTVYQRMSEPVRNMSVFLTVESEVAKEVDRVVVAAFTSRRPVYLFVPMDIPDSLIDASPLEVPLDLSISNPGREAEEDNLVAEIIQLLEQSTDPGILVDALAHRHGLVGEVKKLVGLIDAPVYVTPLSKSIINESDPRYRGVYAGEVSAPEVRESVERHDFLLWIGPFPTYSNTGALSTNLPQKNLVKLEPGYCSIGSRSWDNLHFRPVVEKLLLKLNAYAPKYRDKLSFSSPKIASYDPQLNQSPDPLDQARFWSRLNAYLRPGDCIIAEVGTSQFGSLDLTLPDDSQYFSQFYFSCIGFTVPATLGVLVARREMDHHGRVILFVGDGSLQMTVQEIGTIIRQGFTPTIFVVSNNGYTVERLIHGPQQQYNEISTSWDHQQMLSFFGARAGQSLSYEAKTFAELGRILDDQEFQKSDRIKLLEVFFDQLDSP